MNFIDVSQKSLFYGTFLSLWGPPTGPPPLVDSPRRSKVAQATHLPRRAGLRLALGPRLALGFGWLAFRLASLDLAWASKGKSRIS